MGRRQRNRLRALGERPLGNEPKHLSKRTLKKFNAQPFKGLSHLKFSLDENIQLPTLYEARHADQ